MTAEEIYRHCLGHIPVETLGELAEGAAQPWVTVAPDSLLDVLTYLRDDPALAFGCLDCLTVTDLLDEGQMEVVYHLYSYEQKHLFVVKSRTGRDEPEVPSVTGIWPAANWYEREIYDLFGVNFTGHPDLRRLLLPEDWQGHPMLKDWQEQPFYNGMPTTRENPLDLLAEDVK